MANLFRCAGAGGEDIKCIERPYNSNDIYNTGDTAMYNGLLRICTADGVTGEFDVSKWEVTTLDELLGENIGENDALVDYIASEYDPTHTYAAGDAILGDNGEILKCLEDDVTGEFDNSKWSRDYLCNLSGNVNSNLMQYAEGDKTDAKNGVEFTINCGFKPDIVIITVMSSGYINYYDSKISETIGFRGGINYGKYDIKSTVANGLRSINDDGFTASFGTATNLTFHWQAIKLQR